MFIRRLKLEIGKIVALVVMKGEHLQAGFGERDRANLALFQICMLPVGTGNLHSLAGWPLMEKVMVLAALP